jgi:HEAT repeat protein
MSTMLMVLLVLLLPPLQTGAVQTASSMQPDVDRLVRAAEQLTGTWPSQPPPAIPEVAIVARHGKAVVPLLVSLLSDDPRAGRDRRRWKVQQQVALTLSRIYSESPHCGRSYCDGDPPERIAHVRAGWLRVIASDKEMRALSVRDLLDRFKGEPVFWRQHEIGKALVAANDRAVIPELEAWLGHDDRHLRGNVAFVLARLGDPRGFRAIAEILTDRSMRPAGQGIAGRDRSMQAQIRADRFYAAHLLGDLRDPRGVELLIPLLNDEDVYYKAPWSLAEIGDRRAVGPLIGQLKREDPSVRVLAILALETLKAHEALPVLRELVRDTRKSSFGNQTTVAEAARHAIAVVSQLP